MGIFDNIKDQFGANKDKINEGIEKAGDFIDEKTGGKFADKVDQVQDAAEQQVNKLGEES